MNKSEIEFICWALHKHRMQFDPDERKDIDYDRIYYNISSITDNTFKQIEDAVMYNFYITNPDFPRGLYYPDLLTKIKTLIS